MLSLYVFSVIVGGVLLAVGALGSGGHHGHDGDFDHAHHDTDGAGKLLSLRTLTYFLFVFGGVGAALSWGSGMRSLFVLPLALLAGVGVAGLVGFTFRYLAQTESGGRDGEDSFVGLQGRIVLPVGPECLGKVVVHRGDRTYELIARPLDASAAGCRGWTSVVVVEMKKGIALVAPLDDAVLLEGS
jgi:hypothetical protein